MGKYVVEVTKIYTCTLEASGPKDAAARAEMLNVGTDMECIDTDFTLTNRRTGKEYDSDGEPRYA